ncbi:glycoside hydrolase family 127 protein [Microlunatus panaciterrae]|uniref:DUF1680 family protein n=1 Tax=Microlunatus panaciterrae TaxID=400768 RepID=A0ABS2RNL3_9ACTN|nr:beta-L-arabinofuranosidase domain-containing protein [Microlunatus panaciterrae]MBM7800606.1 DUF1680 family protein [Microlunatus panaciterrae]
MSTAAANPNETLSSGQAPARPGPQAVTTWRPLGLDTARITGGFWAPRQEANAAKAILSGRERLEDAGNLQNFRIAAGQGEGEPIGPIFADSDVYKWLEAVAWEYGRNPDPALLQMQREVTALVAAAQCEDGYLDTVVTLRHADRGRYFDLPWSHEHYCAGHLMQAAVAQVRCTGDRELLGVATRLADHLVSTFGEDKRHDVDGHPVIEMGLVELYRETGNADYLELARYFVDARGHGLMESYGKEPTYFSDRVPVREASSVEGHAVRAVYLAAGAADLAIETGDQSLLEALAGQFDHMWSTKTFLTGGLGARWEGEAFGDPYELPSDRGYAETCAAIGGIQWAWRMLLATGEAHYADAIERMLFNGFLSGVSLSGTQYFYVNPLQVRGEAHPDGDRSPAHGRRGWFSCACCPPNLMRTLASLDGYLASSDAGGLQIHQFAPAQLTSPALSVEVATEYPWQGRVAITVTAASPQPTALSLRVPGWADGATLSVDGDAEPVTAGEYAVVERVWSVGDRVELDLPLAVRHTFADPRIDAIRGCMALERGPLVYAVEQVDQPDGVDLDLAQLVSTADSHSEHRADLLDGVTVITAAGKAPSAPKMKGWPYPAQPGDLTGRDVELVAIPYYAWANREIGAMRVWLPATSA